MRAIEFTSFGGPEVLRPVERPRPTPGPGEALVRVAVIGVNLAETLQRQDRYAVTPPLPAIPGSEAVGWLEALGPGASGPAIGTRVAAPLFAAGRFLGGYAEYVTLPAEWLAPLPDGLDFDQAAALLVQGLTALYLLRQAPPAGRRVLVTAAAGGVGSLLLQLARRAGAAEVLAAASSAEKLDFARRLGADRGFDYSQADWTRDLPAPDLVYESVGGAVTPALLQALAPGGRLLIYGALNIQSFQLGVPELLGLIFRNQWVGGFALAPLLDPAGLKAGLAELFALALSGALAVTIDGRFPLAEAAAAHRALESRATRGKLLLVP